MFWIQFCLAYGIMFAVVQNKKKKENEKEREFIKKEANRKEKHRIIDYTVEKVGYFDISSSFKCLNSRKKGWKTEM